MYHVDVYLLNSQIPFKSHDINLWAAFTSTKISFKEDYIMWCTRRHLQAIYMKRKIHSRTFAFDFLPFPGAEMMVSKGTSLASSPPWMSSKVVTRMSLMRFVSAGAPSYSLFGFWWQYLREWALSGTWAFDCSRTQATSCSEFARSSRKYPLGTI